ncbi:hypothetical protein B0O99DRAFT_739026 [Bisporella sp. PMI_857]|nr:hypothetical protein B0O99DRAFT_739026 [Bisporella sp. PMI_857]
MPTRSNAATKKVEMSFTNWMLGGSLITAITSESDGIRHRASGRKVLVTKSIADGAKLKVVTSEKQTKKDKEGSKYNGEEECTCNCPDCGHDSKLHHKKDDGKKGGPNKDSSKDKSKKDESEKHEPKKVHHKKAEPKSDEGKKDTGIKSNGASTVANVDAASSRPWTFLQDEAIKEMKAAGRSWNDIAAEVGATKNQVRQRFKELNDIAAAGAGVSVNKVCVFSSSLLNGSRSERTYPADYYSEPAPETAPEPEKQVPGAFVDGGDSAINGFETLFLDDAWGVNDFSGATKPQDAGDNKRGGTQSCGNGSADSSNYKACNEGGGQKGKKSRDSQAGNHGQSSSGNGGGDENWNNGGPVGGALPELKTDGRFDKSDCDMLMWLEARYMDEKWMQLQAGPNSRRTVLVAAAFIYHNWPKDLRLDVGSEIWKVSHDLTGSQVEDL